MELIHGYVGLTDPDWHEFLSTQPRIDEANFWQPHGGRTFRALEPGEPFFFKLRAPHKAIAGFGFFERFESLPAWLAWECFGPANGAPDFETMVERILRLRGERGSSLRAGNFEIGCVLLSAPVFFGPSEWVDPPVDWAKTGIQQGKRYALSAGEGKRLLGECLTRARSGGRHWNVEPSAELVAGELPRYGTPALVRPRLGQGGFSLAVREAYKGACAVSREHSGPVLEAAHIMPYSQGGQHRVDNGMLLRRDLHRLYDLGYVTVTPDYAFRVGDSLRDEFQNGRSYYDFDGSRIEVPVHEAWRPNRELLEWHGRELFKG